MKHDLILPHKQHSRWCYFDDEQTGTAQTVVTSSPFPAQETALTRGFGRAEDLFQQPVEFFPNSRIVPFSPQTEAALGQQEQRATQGSPLNSAASDTLLSTIRGDFLNQDNPAFTALSDRLAGDVSGRVNSIFANSGRTGSLANQETLSRGIGDAIAPLAFQNFAQERGNQIAAARGAPQFAANDFFDIAQLGDVGQKREAQAGSQLQDQIDRFNFQQTEPRDRLKELLGLVGGGKFGNVQTTQSPIFESSGASQGLGAAATLAGIGGSLFGGSDAIFPNFF